MLHLAGEYQISEIPVKSGHWLANKTICDAALRQEGVTVLGIDRANGDYLGAPDGDTEINHDDILIVYGRASLMEELEKRSSGSAGNKEHRAKVLDQERIKKVEKQKDST